jgi:glucokinase
VILTGDIGGTKTLLAIHDEGGAIVFRSRYPSAAAAEFADLVAAFLDEAGRALPGRPRPRLACFGIAGPVLGEQVKVTHLPWQIDAAALRARFGFERALLINDFAAAAHGIDRLAPDHLVTLQAGSPLPASPRVVIGAGTGLGLAFVADGRVLAGEGGHATFAPAHATQAALAQWLRGKLGRVQVEHVVSGAGFVRIYEFLLSQRRAGEGAAAREALAAADPAPEIARRALEGGDALALAAVDLFLACYGALAGDHALAVLARGGVFVTGGIAPRLLARLRDGGFLAAFNDKDEFSPVTRACPVHVVLDADLPLLGAAAVALRAEAA